MKRVQIRKGAIRKRTFREGAGSAVVRFFKKEIILTILLYILTIIIVTWPLALHMDGFLLPREYPDISHADTLQHISYINATKENLVQGRYPFIADKADVSPIYIYEGLLSTDILGMNVVVFHNMFFMTVLFLSGLFMYLLMKELSKNGPIAAFAGFLIIASNYISYVYYWGHSNTIQVQWLFLIFFFLERWFRTGRARHMVFFGITLSLQVYSGTYHVVHLGFIIPLYLVLRTISVDRSLWKQRKTYLHLLLGFAAAFVLSSFYLLQKIFFSPEVIKRTIEENSRDVWRLYDLRQILRIDFYLYMGAIQFILALAGLMLLIYLLVKKKTRGYMQYIPYAVIGILTLFLMMGAISPFAPYYWLYHYPFFNLLRVPVRMYPFFMIGVTMLACIPLLKVYDRWKSKAILLVAIGTIMLAIIFFQVLPSPWLSHHHMYYLP